MPRCSLACPVSGNFLTRGAKFVIGAFVILSGLVISHSSFAQPTNANLFVDLHNFTSSAVVSRRVTLTLLEAGPVTAGPWLIAGDSLAQFTDTNGCTTFTNVLEGGYRLDIAGTPSRSFPFGFPSNPASNGVTLNVASLIGATNTLPLYYSVDQLAALGVPPFPPAITNVTSNNRSVAVVVTGESVDLAVTNLSGGTAANAAYATNAGAALTVSSWRWRWRWWRWWPCRLLLVRGNA